MAALTETAAEHGVSADKLQQLMAGFGGPEAIMGQIGSLFAVRLFKPQLIRWLTAALTLFVGVRLLAGV